MLQISHNIHIADDELELSAIRASGPGGQNVNKVSSAIHLRFDINRSSLPAACKARLLARGDKRINREGILTIKAQRFRSQEKNRADALARLQALVEQSLVAPRKRVASKPSRTARKKRVDNKTRRGQLKRLRTKIGDD